MLLKSKFKGLSGLTAVAAAAALGLSACGGGGGGAAAPAPAPTTSGYVALDARPAAATTTVGTSPAALSSAIGIGGAARVSGSIPSPAASATARSARNPLLTAKTSNEQRVARKLAQAGKNPLIADTPQNRELVQGYWWDSVYGEHVAIIDEDLYAVYLSPSCEAFVDGNVTESLSVVTSVTSTTLNWDDGEDSGTLTRDTSGQIAACVATVAGNGTGTGTGTGAAIVSNVGQVSFSDNSTFAYSFTATTQPTAVFVQIDGASEYFVLPLSALTVNGTTYSFNFFGPTPSDIVTQVINQLLSLSNGIVIQAFYGSATAAELLTGSFPGASTASNWSAPAYVDCVAQPTLSGALQFTLNWDTTADLDLWVEEPDATRIGWSTAYRGTDGLSLSPGGGALDVDDVNGYGPENIYYPSEPAVSGTYQVWVDHYSGASPSSYTLTVTRNGVPQTYTGSVSSGGESTPITVSIP